MARPSNEHHVHSDGYTSDRGDPDTDRMLRELADEIEMDVDVEQTIVRADTNGPVLEVEHNEQYAAIVDVVDEWDRCDVVMAGDGWSMIRPE